MTDPQGTDIGQQGIGFFPRPSLDNPPLNRKLSFGPVHVVPICEMRLVTAAEEPMVVAPDLGLSMWGGATT